MITNESLEAVLSMFKEIKSFNLELLDISEVSMKPSIEAYINSVTSVHPGFKCLHGFLNFGEKKIHMPSEDALSVIQLYCTKNNITLIDLFSKLDKVDKIYSFIRTCLVLNSYLILFQDGSMALTYDEFREGLRVIFRIFWGYSQHYLLNWSNILGEWSWNLSRKNRRSY